MATVRLQPRNDRLETDGVARSEGRAAGVGQLPPMGRPSVTGLSIKQLGEKEYKRRYRLLRRGKPLLRPRWTGLSNKLLGHTEYNRQYRKLKSNL